MSKFFKFPLPPPSVSVIMSNMFESSERPDPSNLPQPSGLTKLAKAESTLLTSSNEVRQKFRDDLVPMAFGVYKILMLDEDPKVRKAAADSVMKIEGSLAPPSQASGGSANPSAVFNFDLRSLTDGLKKVANADLICQDRSTERRDRDDER